MITDIVIEPTTGEFDLAQIEHKLLSMPTVARSHKLATRFMLAPDQETLDEAVENSHLEPPRRDFSIALVTLASRRILVAFRTLRTDVPRAFVAWLQQHQPVKILDAEFNDLSADLDPNLDFIFGPTP